MTAHSWLIVQQGLSGLEVVAMANLMNKSAEAQVGREGRDVGHAAMMGRSEVEQRRQPGLVLVNDQLNQTDVRQVQQGTEFAKKRSDD